MAHGGRAGAGCSGLRVTEHPRTGIFGCIGASTDQAMELINPTPYQAQVFRTPLGEDQVLYWYPERRAD